MVQILPVFEFDLMLGLAPLAWFHGFDFQLGLSNWSLRSAK